MATLTTDPFDTVFQGKAAIPDKFVINYKASGSTATVQVHYIDEEGATGTLLSSAVGLDNTRYQATILELPIQPIYAFWLVFANVEDLLEINNIVLISKHNTPITYSIN